jgi:urease accessory protein
MSWQAHLTLNYRRDGERTVVRDQHVGPLRILQSLYPEGAGICHNVVVHPPAGLAGGDELHLQAHLSDASHALLTTPGATRFYRSLGKTALQSVITRVDAGARLEWLPMETLVHPRALAESRLRFELANDAEMIGWDVMALGLPASGEAFDEGRFTQEIELPGVWLERGTVDGRDERLLNSPLGWAGHSVLATMWFASGHAIDRPRSEALLDLARELCTNDSLKATSGVTSPHPQVVVLRALAHRVEPAMKLLQSVWSAWRLQAWGLKGNVPRVWRT